MPLRPACSSCSSTSSAVRRLEVAGGERQRIDHFLARAPVRARPPSWRCGDRPPAPWPPASSASASRPACSTAPWRPCASSPIAPTSREISSRRCCSAAVKVVRPMMIDRTIDFQMRRAAPGPRRARARGFPGSRSVRAGSRCCSSALQIAAGPPRARRVSRSSVSTVSSERTTGSVGGADEGQLQDVAIVQQLARTRRPTRSLESSGRPSTSSACGVTASCIRPLRGASVAAGDAGDRPPAPRAGCSGG